MESSDLLEGPNTPPLPQLKKHLDPSEKEWRKGMEKGWKMISQFLHYKGGIWVNFQVWTPQSNEVNCGDYQKCEGGAFIV